MVSGHLDRGNDTGLLEEFKVRLPQSVEKEGTEARLAELDVSERRSEEREIWAKSQAILEDEILKS